ncbi:MAG TPA: phosphoribosyltransferase [Ktedonobacterales bacterium]|nr:phosphoribosyltransferase [Ktedonobacterales bacterium]
MRFYNRTEAGRALAAALMAYAQRPDVLVLGLPRGGVAVAYEVARALQVPLDLLLVRKLGVPGQEELALGALASGEVRVLNERVIHELAIPESIIEAATANAERELMRRERLYRGHRPAPQVQGRVIILVDDGVATGATMQAAIMVIRRQHPARLVVAIPVAPPSVYEEIQAQVDELVCLMTPEVFMGVGVWYEDFSQLTDRQVRTLLEQARKLEAGC